MKKYKLIKEYPGSPRLGSIHFWSEKECTTGWLGEIIYDNNPEFWKEIIDKDYEILSIRKIQRTNNINSINEWVPNRYEGITLEEILYVGHCVKSGHYYIHSIKRLSDGEVFTIGDAVQLQMSNGKWWKETNCILSMIVIEDNKVVFYIDQGDIKYSKYSSDLSDWRKAKTPLFVTEDDVEIFEGDKCYIVGNNWNWIEQTAFTNEYGNNKTTYKQVWATKEAAEKWIDENKPKYSKKEILNIIEEVFEFSVKDLKLYVGTRLEKQIDFEGYYLAKLRDKILK